VIGRHHVGVNSGSHFHSPFFEIRPQSSCLPPNCF
jgi:hypothetical protein